MRRVLLAILFATTLMAQDKQDVVGMNQPARTRLEKFVSDAKMLQNELRAVQAELNLLDTTGRAQAEKDIFAYQQLTDKNVTQETDTLDWSSGTFKKKKH